MPPHKQRKDEYSRFLFLMGKFSFATKSNAKVLTDLTVLKLRRGHFCIVWRNTTMLSGLIQLYDQLYLKHMLPVLDRNPVSINRIG